jgi:hypothetical protein
VSGLAWARHYQNVWGERAGDASYPMWLRVASAAYGSHRANGHAQYARGALALVLGHVDKTTGEIVPLDRSNLRRAIQTAVEFGWLARQSTARCLVVPAHAIDGGLGGSPHQECPQHSRSRGGR